MNPPNPTLPTSLDAMVSSPKMMFLVASGVIAGLVLGGAAVKHLFVEGLDAQERKNMMKAAAVGLGTWGLSKLLSQEYVWVLDMEAIAEHAAKAAGVQP